MRIACIGQQYKKHDFNGTMQSNAAMAHWATILGHSREMVAFTGRGRPLKDFFEPGQVTSRSHPISNQDLDNPRNNKNSQRVG